ncbi:hypothetical protein PLIIFM63780_007780 [Purpureocillium lilacinum]|nr:hypothetical protein PLIIFM63780_007780 [Purpureocillium lilacinum]
MAWHRRPSDPTPYIILVIAYGIDPTAAWGAVRHGSRVKVKGVSMRYQQLGPGVFTGVPISKWNKKINVPLNTVSNYEKRSLSDFASRLRGNQLKKQCRVVYNCVKDASKVTIAAGYTGWVAAAERAKPAGQSLMQFLNQPFWANAGGVAIAGMISGGVLKAASCSKSNNEADIIKAVVAEALRASPGADKIEVTVGGPYGTWNVVIAATERDHYPPPTCRR